MRPIDADALVEAIKDYPYGFRGMIVCDIAKLPTIDVPDRKIGKWINDRGLYKCSACDNLWTAWWAVIVPEERMYKEMKYCPNCGAKMDDDWEEPEINPCRGCDDYDGRGGCKSHGGCSVERSEE